MDIRISVTSQKAFDRPLKLEAFGLCLELSGIEADSSLTVSEEAGGVSVSLTGSEEAQQLTSNIQQAAVPSPEPICQEDVAVNEAGSPQRTDGSETVGSSETVSSVTVSSEPDSRETANVSEAAESGESVGSSETAGSSETVGSSEIVGSSEDQQDQLFQKLSTLRKKIAYEAGLPPYIIFHDSSLKEMCRLLPLDLEAFKSVQGVGQAKLEKYGALFIAAIRKHTEAA